MEVKLANVVTTFPIGTTVGLYVDWRGDSGEPTPVGAPLKEAVVDANGDLVFLEVPEGRRIYVAAAIVNGEWRFRQVTTPVPATDLATVGAVEAVQTLLEHHEALSKGIHGINADTSSLLVVVETEDPATPRPEAAHVLWICPEAPENAAVSDLWADNS